MFSPLVKENQRQSMIVKYLNSRGFTVWRNNSGAWPVKNSGGNTTWVHNGMKGSPDIVGFTPEGFFLGVEIKQTKQKLGDSQVLFAKKLRDTKHGLYIVAREIEDIMEKLQGITVQQLPL